LVEGIDWAREEAKRFLSTFAVQRGADRTTLTEVTRTALRTKLPFPLADSLSDICVDAVQTISQDGQEIDLHMVEIMQMAHRQAKDTRFIRGIVMDHGARHPNMPTRLENCYILTCNISLEYEKSEVNSGFFYSSADQREAMVKAERTTCDAKVQKIIELKKKLCDGTNKSFVVINQKGVDPSSLDQLCAVGIIALRRAKKRNMERLTLCCGGEAIHSIEALNESVLGYADLVYEHRLGDECYTFVEGVKNPKSCTILVNGPNPHTIAMIKDALKDGLRCVRNAIVDKKFVAGAGAFEIAAHAHLTKNKGKVQGKAKLGVQAFADAMLIIPKVLAVNSGFDQMDIILKLQDEFADNEGTPVGLDIDSGEVCDPVALGIWDNYRVKHQMLESAGVIGSQILLVDEIIRAGRGTTKPSMPI
jgi:T-complex protein 1 subunit zeta